MAAKEKDPQRKAELTEIARICKRVPEHPAATFHEAMQSQWFVQMFSRIEQKTGTIISNGRMDQTVSLLQEGPDEGRITEEKPAPGGAGCDAQFTDLAISIAGAYQRRLRPWEGHHRRSTERGSQQ
jgi:formate C-acetyltransferase